ncbi:MAG TPA: NADH-quinone oxidoreductase subunit C/D [Armatimonadota bacterium]
MAESPDILGDLHSRFPEAIVGLTPRPPLLAGEGVSRQPTADGVPTVWVAAERLAATLGYLKHDAPQPYRLLYDLTVIDERDREHRAGQPASDFTGVYHLSSLERHSDVRVKVALTGEYPALPTITGLWPAANWYEREAWDMFGVGFTGHPRLRRLLMPEWWEGHPLRREHPARATELPPYVADAGREEREDETLQFRPEEWGMHPRRADHDLMILNLGPQHPSTHGLLRLVLELDDEQIVDVVPDIGFHHRGVEKMGERQSWHSYIPYTDRVDYLGGVMNNLPYVLAVEKLAGIEVPERVQVIRVMLCELFRIISHLVFYGTLASDLGAISPVFYMFTDRERAFEVVEAICGARMHPGWFRIGGVAQDLPTGWERLMREFLDYLPARLREYDRIVLNNPIFRARTRGIGAYDTATAVEWGVTGPGLRATGLGYDLRRQRPYSGYERFEFNIPTGERGDCWDRTAVRVEEMRQSLRIIRQCVEQMPAGPYKADHPLTTPPRKERTLHDIETLITHFLSVSWGPVIPPGEACVPVEGTKGWYSYYLISDGNTVSYRTRVRTPSFPHLQMLPRLARGCGIPDLVAILGSIDYVLADVDR